MIGVRGLVNCVNASTSTTTDPLGILQLASVAKDFDTTGFVVSVTSSTNLPSAVDNTGRFIYVEDIGRYKYSDGTSWSTDVTSGPPSKQAWSWGRNTDGNLGDITTVNKSSPVQVSGGFIDWCDISSSDCHSLGVRTNGTAWAWGGNTYGALGDGTTVNKSSPVSVVGGFTDWCQVSAGRRYSLGLRTNGTLWTWGCNSNGQLGDGTTVNKSSPVSVVGGFTDWCHIDTGIAHSLAVRSNGTAWAWGYNGVGRLGDGTTVGKCSPVSVVGGFTWCQVSAGTNHTIAIRNNGTAWAWGYNGQGRLGDNSVTDRSSPVSVVGGFTNWCQVSAGDSNSLGIRATGTAWAWGFNSCGQLGDGTIVSKRSPISVVGGFTDWCQVSAGRYFSLGVRTNGTVWSWGYNSQGQLGDGTLVNRSSPVQVCGGFTNWCLISAGDRHSLGIRSRSTGF